MSLRRQWLLALCTDIAFDGFRAQRGPRGGYICAALPVSPSDRVPWTLILPLGVMAGVAVWAG